MVASLPSVCVVSSSIRCAAWNLALEEWLLDATRSGDKRVFLYVNPACVVIGRHQNPWRECSMPRLRAAGGSLMRRVTGGGAVWHDPGNLNFSFIAGRESFSIERQFDIVARALRALGITVERTTQNALLAGGLKVSGSAFRIMKTGALHHGTLLVKSNLDQLSRCLSPAETAVLSDKAVRSNPAKVGNLADCRDGLTIEDVRRSLIAAWRAETGNATAPIVNADDLLPMLSHQETDRLMQHLKKHVSWEWRFGETPRFEYCIERSGGRLTLSVEAGQIVHVESILGKAEDRAADGRHLEQCLLGSRLDQDEIHTRLKTWMSSRSPKREQIRWVWDWLNEMNI